MIVTAEATGARAAANGRSRGPRGRRPVIGISAYSEQARWGDWDIPALLLPRRYADKVAAAGGVPVLLPPVPGIEEVTGRLDGLILSGGGDIDPSCFGGEPAPQTAGIRPDRDGAEFALAQAALRRGLPFLGICRGMQVLNVVLGGTLHQHLPALVGHEGHAPVPGSFGSHQIRVAPGSMIAEILGPDGKLDELAVPTHHHQGIDRLASGLTATAWTEDGVIEAVERADHGQGGAAFALGVQWHPEAGEDPRLFEALLRAARQLAPTPAPA